jgi:hypothetical protein
MAALLWAIPMTAALTPGRALDYLATLSTDIRASAVLGGDHVLLAGDAALAGTVKAALDRTEERVVRQALPSGTTLLAARSGTHAIAVELGPHPLPSLVALDLRNVLRDLAG